MLKNNQILYLVCFVLLNCCANSLLEAKNTYFSYWMTDDNHSLECEITTLVADVGDCNEDGTYPLTINFEVIEPGNTFFDLFINGEFIDFYEIAALPITLNHVATNTNDFTHLKVCINDTPNCCKEIEFETPNCGDTNNCHIFDVIAEAHECMEDGTFFVDVAFEHNNVGNDGYTIFGNGQVYGSFPYGEPFVTIGPIVGDGETVYEFIVKDNQNNECQNFTTLGPVDCGNNNNCHIFDVIAEAHECLEDGTFFVDVAFEHDNVGNDGYTIFGNGQVYGSFPYGEPFVTIGPIVGDGETVYEFIVKDNQNNECQNFTALGPIDCGGNGGECAVSDLKLDLIDCNEDGTFQVAITFHVENAGNDFFDLWHGEEFVGFYEIADLPLIIENFPGTEGDFDQIKVCVNDNPNCCTYFEFEALNCDGNMDCHIFDVIAEAHECMEDGTFLVDVAFEYENVGNDGFTIFGNGQVYGSFPYGEPFVTIGPLEGDGETVYEFIVKDNQNNECQNFTGLGPIDCSNEGECSIFDLATDALICQSDHTFSLTIGFETENANNDFFDVYLNDELFDFYALADLPVTLEEIPINEANEYIIRICVNDNPNCCESFFFVLPPGFCDGFDVWPGDINLDNAVSHFDLLHLGIAYGFTGPERLDNSIVWEAMPGEDWEQHFENGYNYKHADCDGNGEVNSDDLNAISTNYGLTHGELDVFVPATADENDPALFFEIPETGELPNNTPFSLPIRLGTEALPMEDIYGIAFTIEFDPNVIDPATVDIEYPTSWMGENTVNLLTFDKTFASEGLIHVAVSRNDQNNVSGHGNIAYFIGMIDDILGITVVDVVVKDVYAIDYDETIQPIHTPPTETIKIITNIEENIPMNTLQLFPNPTSDEVFLQYQFDTPVKDISLLDMNGRTLEHLPTDTLRFSMATYAAGMYWVKVETMSGTRYEKLVVVKQ